MKNIFKKNKEVTIEGAENAVVDTPAESGKERNNVAVVLTALGVAAAGAVVALVVKAFGDNAEDAEMCVPDTDEPIEVTDEMIEDVIAN